jgi:hypothetical protein
VAALAERAHRIAAQPLAPHRARLDLTNLHAARRTRRRAP